ncbi:hypothetical protein HZH66_002929 [Vespula vulgaris]|uniref:Uncharacterized protein n=1 Tax=Vespula vulgaris TaxID=7454 RepID=A0A834NGG0_VESVU|nr:hypothetical protein HZH66_002929 [Vespula vulgaris]
MRRIGKKEEDEEEEEWKKDTLGSIKIERIGVSSKGENDVTDLTTRKTPKKSKDKRGEEDTHTRNSGIRDSIIGVEYEMRKIVTKYRTTVANVRDTSAHDVVIQHRVVLETNYDRRSVSTPTWILPRSRVPKKLNTLVRDSRRRRLRNGGSRLRTRVSNDVYDNGRTRFTPAPTFPCKISMPAELRTISRWYGFPWRQCQSASQRRAKSRWKGRSHRVKDSKVDGPTVLRGTVRGVKIAGK